MGQKLSAKLHLSQGQAHSFLNFNEEIKGVDSRNVLLDCITMAWSFPNTRRKGRALGPPHCILARWMSWKENITEDRRVQRWMWNLTGLEPRTENYSKVYIFLS